MQIFSTLQETCIEKVKGAGFKSYMLCEAIGQHVQDCFVCYISVFPSTLVVTAYSLDKKILVI